MANPNSALTKLRQLIVRHLQPHPAPGEAWCVNCARNNGRTLIVSADGTQDHMAEHSTSGEKVLIQTVWPVLHEERLHGT